MANKPFNEILRMVVTACNENFYTGMKTLTEKALECATQIYIAQMKEGAENG